MLIAGYAIPVLGDILRYTVLPVFGWITMPLTKRLMFAPSPVTDRFKAEYATGLELRPSQIRATIVDGTMMVPSAASLRAHYPELEIPVRVLAGSGDLVVRPRQAERLHSAIKGSALRIVPGVGHMIHHVMTAEVIDAVDDLVSLASEGVPAGESLGQAANWRQPQGAPERAASV